VDLTNPIKPPARIAKLLKIVSKKRLGEPFYGKNKTFRKLRGGKYQGDCKRGELEGAAFKGTCLRSSVATKTGGETAELTGGPLWGEGKNADCGVDLARKKKGVDPEDN